MKKGLRRALSILMCIAMLTSFLSLSVFAASPTSGKCGKNAKWSYNTSTQTLTISGKGEANVEKIDIYAEEDFSINLVVKKGITHLTGEFGEMEFRSIKLPGGLKEMCSFCYCGLPSTLTIPQSVTNISEGFCSNNEGLKTIKVAKGNKKFTAKDGVLFSKDMKTLWAYPPSKSGKSYVVPKSVKRIGEFAFGYCNVEKLYFKGKPVSGLTEEGSFDEVVPAIYYPKKYKKQWTPIIRKLKADYGIEFGGAHTWKG